MTLKKLIFYNNGKKTKIYVKPCYSFISKLRGLIFKSNSQPLLFIFKKEKTLSIHSIFCKPFKAIWLNENKQVTKIKEIRNWRLNFSSKGKYLLEIPLKH